METYAVADNTISFRIPNINGVGLDRMDLSAILPAAVGTRMVGNFVPTKTMAARLSVGLVYILHATRLVIGSRGRCDREPPEPCI
jgi:hypothetical protein